MIASPNFRHVEQIGTTGGAFSAGRRSVSTGRIYVSGGTSVVGTSRRVWRILQTAISSPVTT